MNNIKLLFVVFHGIDSSGNGIGKKIQGQFQSFKNLGINASITYLKKDLNNQYDGRIINNTTLEIYKSKYGIDKRYHWRFKFKKLLDYIKQENVNVVFIRYTHFANPFFINFLKDLKKFNVYIIMEIPTYPYDSEYNNLTIAVRIAKFFEEYFRKFFKKFVNKIVTFSNAKEIFGIETIKINNGIDIESIPVKIQSNHKNEIHLIAVASMYFWHGYDRLIEGLRNYYSNIQEIKVFLHLVGDSNNSVSLQYKQLVDIYVLRKYVIFHGVKYGKELDELFNNADLAIGCLGVHRKGISNIKSLKNSEYCARGIPFIYSELDESFESKPFIYKVPANDNPIEIQDLIDFLTSNSFDYNLIRKYAEENLTWDIQIKKVIKECI